jgi:hypothetical protein
MLRRYEGGGSEEQVLLGVKAGQRALGLSPKMEKRLEAQIKRGVVRTPADTRASLTVMDQQREDTSASSRPETYSSGRGRMGNFVARAADIARACTAHPRTSLATGSSP